MKLTLSLLLFLSSSVAFSFTPDEIQKAEQYLLSICMDTYCGGDLFYDQQDLICSKNHCSIEMTVKSYYLSDNKIIQTIPNRDGNFRSGETLKASWVVSDKIATIQEINEEDELVSYSIFSFKCQLKRLDYSLHDPDQTFYEAVVFNCIPQIEKFFRKLVL